MSYLEILPNNQTEDSEQSIKEDLNIGKTIKIENEAKQENKGEVKKEKKDTQTRICSECGFEAKRRPSLKTHKMTHDDSLKIKCDQYHKSIDATRLKFHKAKEHGGLEAPCNFGNCELKTSN